MKRLKKFSPGSLTMALLVVVMLAEMLFLCLGCQAIPDPDRRVVNYPGDSVAAADIRIGDELLDSLKNDDYPRFASLLDGELAGAMTEKDFATSYRNITAEFGEISGYEYLFSLRTPVVKNMIWRVDFTRRTDSGELVEQQMLFRLVLGDTDEGVHVVSFGFI